MIPSTEYQIAHGSSKFIKSEKLAQLQLQKKHSAPGQFADVLSCEVAGRRLESVAIL